MNRTFLEQLLRARLQAGATGGPRFVRVGGFTGFLLLFFVLAFSLVAFAFLAVGLAVRGAVSLLLGGGPGTPRTAPSRPAPTMTVEDATGRTVATVER